MADGWWGLDGLGEWCIRHGVRRETCPCCLRDSSLQARHELRVVLVLYRVHTPSSEPDLGPKLRGCDQIRQVINLRGFFRFRGPGDISLRSPACLGPPLQRHRPANPASAQSSWAWSPPRPRPWSLLYTLAKTPSCPCFRQLECSRSRLRSGPNGLTTDAASLTDFPGTSRLIDGIEAQSGLRFDGASVS